MISNDSSINKTEDQPMKIINNVRLGVNQIDDDLDQEIVREDRDQAIEVEDRHHHEGKEIKKFNINISIF